MGGERLSRNREGAASETATAQSTPDLAVGRSSLVEDTPPTAAAHEAKSQQGQARVVAQIVGHASPRWRRPGASARDARNLKLSRERAEVVQIELESLFGELLPEASAQCLPSVVDDHDGISFGVEARGSKDTIDEADGDRERDEQRLRRVDVAVEVHRSERGVNRQSSSTTRQVTPRVYDATDQWRVQVHVGAGAHKFVGGSMYFATLTNELTKKSATCVFVGGGIGAGVKSKWTKGGDAVPTVSTFDAGESFRTYWPVTFHDFHLVPARILEMSINVIVAGASLAYLRLPTLCGDAISIGGFEQGGLGAGAKGDVGVWQVLNAPPPLAPRTVRDNVTIEEPYERPVKQVYRHTVHFETEQSSLDPVQRDLLTIFAEGVAAGTEGKTILRAQPVNGLR
jgi:hypothetical protein